MTYPLLIKEDKRWAWFMSKRYWYTVLRNLSSKLTKKKKTVDGIIISAACVVWFLSSRVIQMSRNFTVIQDNHTLISTVENLIFLFLNEIFIIVSVLQKTRADMIRNLCRFLNPIFWKPPTWYRQIKIMMMFILHQYCFIIRLALFDINNNIFFLFIRECNNKFSIDQAWPEL